MKKVKTRLERVMDSQLYKSGNAFRSEAVQRIIRETAEESEGLIQYMLDEGLIKILPHGGRSKETATYARHDKARDLAMYKPWRPRSPEPRLSHLQEYSYGHFA